MFAKGVARKGCEDGDFKPISLACTPGDRAGLAALDVPEPCGCEESLALRAELAARAAVSSRVNGRHIEEVRGLRALLMRQVPPPASVVEFSADVLQWMGRCNEADHVGQSWQARAEAAEAELERVRARGVALIA